jgi:hypothetical protein
MSAFEALCSAALLLQSLRFLLDFHCLFGTAKKFGGSGMAAFGAKLRLAATILGPEI